MKIVSVLKLLNMFIFQWFLFRVVRYRDNETLKTMGYGIMYFILPLSGWRTNHKPIGKMKFSRIIEPPKFIGN